jgi:glycosyltransferase involved in cell wall biosynthesis
MRRVGDVGPVLPVSLVLLAMRHRFDVISVTTMPPVVMGLAALAARAIGRGRPRVVYHCMDIYPEVALAQGMLAPGLVAKIARRLDRFVMEHADQVIVLSADMAKTVERRGTSATPAVANNFSTRVFGECDAMTKRSDRQHLVFAGNLGRFQGIDTLLEAIDEVASERDDFCVTFMGDGSMAPAVDRKTASPCIALEPHRSLEEAMDFMASADAGIVSLAPGVIDCAYPSKLMTYLEVGLPIIAVVEADSELADFVESHSLGWVASPNDVGAIAAALSSAIDGARGADPKVVQATGREYFGEANALGAWDVAYGLHMVAS